MVAISRIVLPTDFSDLAIGAAAYARFLALAHGARVHVVHFVSPVIVDVDPTVPGVPPVVNDVTDADRARLDAFVAAHLQGVPNVVAEVRPGFPANDLGVYAARIGADLIVIGTHADGIWKRIFHGSLSKSVLESAPCPVLMVPLAALHPAGGAGAAT